MLALATAAAAEVELAFPAVVVLEDGRVELEVKGRPEPAAPPYDMSSPSVYVASAGDFRLSVDSAAIQPTKHWEGFQYEFYLEAPDGRSARFPVVAYPTGKFAYTIGEVDFEARSDGAQAVGSIHLPLYSLRPPAFVEWINRDEVFEAELGVESYHPIRLRNALPDLRAVVRPGGRISARPLWRLRLLHLGEPGWEEMTLRSGSDSASELQLVAQPSFLAGLSQAFRRRPQRITVPLEYHSVGGPPLPLSLELQMRLVPSIPALCGAWLAGVLLGTTLPFLNRRQAWRKWPRAFLASLGLTLLLWGLAAVLFEADSRLVLFGYGVDPNDLISVGVTAALVSLGGRRSWDWITGHLPIGGGRG